MLKHSSTRSRLTVLRDLNPAKHRLLLSPGTTLFSLYRTLRLKHLVSSIAFSAFFKTTPCKTAEVFHGTGLICDRDPIMIDATLNCLAVLIRSRPAIANKTLAAVLNFNPLKHAAANMTPRTVVILRSMERTTRALLRFVMRAIPNNPLEQKIQAYLLRLQQSRTAFFSDSPSLKRPAEPTDGLNDAKRQRLTAGQRKVPPMPPPPNTIAQLFTLTEDPAIQQFDVKYLPLELIDFTIPLLLKSVPQENLDEASDAVRARFNHLQKASLPTPIPDIPMAGPTGIDDEDEYDPEFDLAPDTTQNNTTSDNALEELIQPAIDLGPFELPKPPPLTGTEVTIVSEQSINHVFGLVQSLDLMPTPSRQKVGFNRLAASANDRDAWVTILIRLVTRTPAAIKEYDDNATTAAKSENTEQDDDEIEKEEEQSTAVIKPDPESPTIANRIRHKLFMYILEDFRARLNVAISWLSEEWYADKISIASQSQSESAATTSSSLLSTPNYETWSLRLLDSLLPYFDARDKNILIRFLSEIPSISMPLLEMVAKQLARDPERIAMFVLAMQYLLMFRVPCRELVLGVLEDVYEEGERQGDEAVRGSVGKVLKRWRPGWLERREKEETETGTGDVKAEIKREGMEEEGKVA